MAKGELRIGVGRMAQKGDIKALSPLLCTSQVRVKGGVSSFWTGALDYGGLAEKPRSR